MPLTAQTMIELVEGDLLAAPVEALVNAVNTQGVMGKGIALAFKNRFPEMFEDYRQACASGRVTPGCMHVFDCGIDARPQFLINFPTKRNWRDPSQLEDIEAGLRALVGEIRQRKIRSIALPALGCGLGGLDWPAVLDLMTATLKDLEGVRILVYRPQNAVRTS